MSPSTTEEEVEGGQGEGARNGPEERIGLRVAAIKGEKIALIVEGEGLRAGRRGAGDQRLGRAG